MKSQDSIAVLATQGEFSLLEQSLAKSLDIECLCEADLKQEDIYFFFRFTRSGLELCESGNSTAKPTKIDFDDPRLLQRANDGIKQQNLIKSLGLKKKPNPKVMDAMAGLGTDAFLMASAGCHVQMIERSALIHALLKDGLDRLTESSGAIAHKLVLGASSREFLDVSIESSDIDIVYLDPMYAQEKRKSKAKRDMSRLHALLGTENNERELLAHACSIAHRRVVVKRPKHAPDFAGKAADISFKGSSARFDVYLIQQTD